MTATLFVPTGFVGGRSSWLQGADGERPMLSWETIASLAREASSWLARSDAHGGGRQRAPRSSKTMRAPAGSSSRITSGSRSRASPIHSATTRRRPPGGARRGLPPGLRRRRAPARAHDDRWALPRMQVLGHTTPEEVAEMVTWRPPLAARASGELEATRLAGRTPMLAGWGPAEAGRLEGAVR